MSDSKAVCPRCGTEGCPATQIERTGGTVGPAAFDLLLKAAIACTLRAIHTEMIYTRTGMGHD